MKIKKYLFSLFIITFLIYTPSLFSGFAWLDHTQVLEEGLIIHDFKELFKSFFSPLMSKHGDYYRPVFEVSLTIDNIIFNKNPFGYHFTNIVLHLFNTALIFFILIRSFSKEKAFFISLIWAIHPIGVFVVSHISARSDLLYALFLLLSFYFYTGYKDSEKKLYLICSLLSFILSLMSKEAAVVYPLIIFIYEILSSGKKRWKAALCFVLLSILFVAIKIVVTGKLGTRIPLFYGEPLTVIPTMIVVILDYWRKIIFPLGLAMSDAFIKYDTFHPLIYLSLLIFSALFFVSFKKRKEDASLLFSLLWFFILLIPTSNIIPALHFRAERFIYLAYLGAICFLVNLPAVFKQGTLPEAPKTSVGEKNTLNLITKYHLKKILFLFLLILLSVITIQRQFDFKDDITLSKRVIKIEPNSREAYQTLGFYYFKNQDYQNAIYYLNKALEPNSRYYSYVHSYGVYNNLGVIYLRLNRITRAIDYLNKALAASDEAVGHLNLYYCYALSGKDDEAQKQLEIARTLDPDLVAKYIK